MTQRAIDMYATPGERAVAERLVRAAIGEEMLVSVSDGEEWTVERSRSVSDIMDALATTGGDVIRIWDGSGATRGWFYLVYGNDEDGSELIADHTDNATCEDLCRMANELTGD